MPPTTRERIAITGASQNNLRDLDLEIPLGELVVVTGVSGSGKSSLAFDTIYAEGQRRYVETFSPYARQFLDRMDKPSADSIDGIPPAIAIDQTNPVRTSRSTVGTMTELNDHLKLLFARCAQLYCKSCAAPVERDDPQTIAEKLLGGQLEGLDSGSRAAVSFTVKVPDNFTAAEVKGLLERQGYLRILSESARELEVLQDRLRLEPANRARLVEGLESALLHGSGKVQVRPVTRHPDTGEPVVADHPVHRFSSEFHCPQCDIDYKAPIPSQFSFNSPAGACESCRGFGRTMGIDYGLVIPDESKSLAEGAIKPWQTDSYIGWQRDMMRHAKAAKIPTKTPWRDLSKAHRDWVLDGKGTIRSGKWYGLRRFFDWLERKSYRMHIRVLLSRYRAYNLCETCHGARLRPEALLWRVGEAGLSQATLPSSMRTVPPGIECDEQAFRGLPGLNIHDLVSLPLSDCQAFFSKLELPGNYDEAMQVLLEGIRARLDYLVHVGLGYLNLDRQSRTLSGGEVQRINLTTALGTSLVNTLFVLDEPSIGLHARDMARVVDILRRLRQAGNSLLVVEHDAQVMLNADRIIDMGPGPGEHGGQIVFQGTPRQLLNGRGKGVATLTGQYLSGARQVTRAQADRVREVPPPSAFLTVEGANENNLDNLRVSIPLERLVCVTGVSGSGKSTLIEDVLYRGLCKHKGVSTEAPGAHDAIRGHEAIDNVLMVDQTPIGKTTRSNPASYIGVMDGIRKLFAAEPLAIERGYKPGTFSFNSGDGRCPTCSGNGFEHVEMQFLSDVYLRCPDCDGKRYRPEVLEVLFTGATASGNSGGAGNHVGSGDRLALSIADVLELTANEAVEIFSAFPEVHRPLDALVKVGLGYLKLGQPVPTLSGGESQRLKLAGFLGKRSPGRKKGAVEKNLYLFDEPTTGLHFEDVSVLVRAFDALLAQGHSIVVIEHHMDVIANADWIIDLGPEGGAGGGQLVAEGPPETVAAISGSHTGQALAQHFRPNAGDASDLLVAEPRAPRMPTKIAIRNAREHNLRNVDIDVPRGKFTVVSGVSGSGKSTVAFDVLFNEGQRRYLESLNAYARQFVQPAARPEVDAIYGIPPTVAIEQRTSRGGRKSTVATLTEVYHFLRLLFVRLGTQHCPDCGTAISPQSEDAVAAQIMKRYSRQTVELHSPLVVSRKGYYTELAKWAAKRGYEHLIVDGKPVPTNDWPRLDRYQEHDIDLPVARMKVSPGNEAQLRTELQAALRLGNGLVKAVPVASGESALFSVKRSCPSCDRNFPEPDPRQFSFNSKHGWCPKCFGTGQRISGFDEEQTGEESVWVEEDEAPGKTCTACDGRRLNPDTLAIRFAGKNIAQFTELSIAKTREQLHALNLDAREQAIAHDVLAELLARLTFLDDVGLGYLGLDRGAPTLSGGEAQRIRLAAQLGSNLRGVCYILDEPTIGLHTRDNAMLLNTLQALRSKGNTVVVVEHDEATMKGADHLIDLGPGAGVNGGRVVAKGSLKALMASKESLTGKALREPLAHPMFARRRNVRQLPAIEIKAANRNNLKRVNARVPLQSLVCVTGVSGSGKSTLVRGVLVPNLVARLGKGKSKRGNAPAPVDCAAFTGWESISRVLEVDQTPIGKTPRSCPATYIGIWDHIRRLFAETAEARLRGYGPGRFSFNVKGGRCESCEGQGLTRMEMSFLPDVRVPCDACGGQRFNPDTLQITYRDRNIAEVLDMSVDAAVDFFIAHKRVHHALSLLRDVGLGYLTLGQASPTLSGGEAQRIKLVSELTKVRSPEEQAALESRAGRQLPRTLYVLDEPTIGLHMADVEKLIRVLHRLVDGGHSVVIIEHNLDVIAEADHIIDMGPEGGEAGGKLIASGTPERVASAKKRHHTTVALDEFLTERRPAAA